MAIKIINGAMLLKAFSQEHFQKNFDTTENDSVIQKRVLIKRGAKPFFIESDSNPTVEMI